MNLERYECDIEATEDSTQYEFYSHGPKGVIKKFILFNKISDNYYNLSFGDQLSGTDSFSDEINSNNGDAEKVLFTVAESVMEFTDDHYEATIHAEGSTAARTRLYRIYINKHRRIINRHFHINAQLINGAWEKFRKNGQYIAFSGTRKYLYF
jgi:hypothetical protein